MDDDQTSLPLDAAEARRTHLRLAAFALVLLATALFGVRVAKIRASLPYSLHFDEKHLTDPARGIMQTGDWNPHWFQYPTLPIYMTTAGMSAGLLRSAGMRRTHRVEDIGSVAAPYYDDGEIVFIARALFALISVLTVLLIGGIAWRLSGSISALMTAPTLFAASPLASFHGWAYLNVDVVGTFFVTLCVWHALRSKPADSSESLGHDGWLAGALAGLAISSKYSLFLVMVPGLLRAVNHHPGRRSKAAIAFITATIGTFAVMTPGLLDMPAFLDGLAHEIRHYASGHGDASIEAGLPHLLAFGHDFMTEAGWAVPFLALFGVVSSLRSCRSRAILTVAFPALILLYLSRQQVHFTRNTLAMLPFVAVFGAVGASAITRWLGERRFLAARPGGRLIAGGAVAALVLASLPWKAIPRQFKVRLDSRTQAVAWVRENIPVGSRVFVAEEIEMDLRSLTEWQIEPFSLYGPNTARMIKNIEWSTGSYALLPVPLPETWAALESRKPLIRFGALPIKLKVKKARQETEKRSLLRPGGNPTLRIVKAR